MKAAATYRNAAGGGGQMPMEKAQGKGILLVTAATCSVLFGIPLILYFFKILGGLFDPSVRGMYLFDDFQRDTLIAVVLGALTVLPVAGVYYYFFLRQQTEKLPPPPAKPSAESPELPKWKEQQLSSGDSDASSPSKKPKTTDLIYQSVSICGGITALGVVYTFAMRDAYGRYGLIDGLSVAWTWSMIVFGVAMAVKLKDLRHILLGALFGLLGMIPVLGLGLGCLYVTLALKNLE